MPLANKELNDIILRPRFTFEIEQAHETALSAFEASKKTQEDFIINRVSNHVFIKVTKAKQQYTSPQLHLEITAINEHKSIVNGIFGPNPTVWTFFMFLHFIVVGLFIAISIWTYTNWSLGRPFDLQIVFILVLLFTWLGLYFIGQSNKKKSIPEMLEQHHFMRDVLRNK